MTDDEMDREAADADDLDDEARLGAAMAGDPDSLISLLGHFYRGQLDRETTWRSRLDRTTNWAVIVIATLLTWTFSGQGNPHYILLVGALLIVIFLAIEAHRYRAYDVPRSRVRMLEEDLFAQLFAPDAAVEHDEWRRLMSEDLRRPAAKVTVREAVGRRLRRVYLPLTTILLAAWVVTRRLPARVRLALGRRHGPRPRLCRARRRRRVLRRARRPGRLAADRRVPGNRDR